MPETPKSDGIRPTQVWFVTGRKENKAFRQFVPPRLIREEATLSDNKENLPPADDTKESSQHNQPQKA